MANQIPNTSTPGQVLTSIGNGTNASTWAVASGSGSLPSGTAVGQMIYWNGTSWVTTTAPTYNGQVYWWDTSSSSWATSAAYAPTGTNSYLRWNGTEWEPDTGELLGDITGTFSTSHLAAINGVTTDISSSPSVGDVIQYSSAIGWYNGPITLPSGNGYSWTVNSGGAQTITSSVTNMGSITQTVSGYTQYQVIAKGSQYTAASGTSGINVGIGLSPYGGSYLTGGSAVTVCLASTTSGSYSNFSQSFTVYTTDTSSHTIAPFIYNGNTPTTNPEYAYFEFTVLGVR